MAVNELCAPDDFRDALHKGLGRAVGHVRAARPETIRADLLHACMHYVGLDLQCEGSRAPWLFGMIEQTGEAAWYRDGIIAALARTSDDFGEWRSRSEMVDLLMEFARRGDATASAAVRARVLSAQIPADPTFGHEALLALDGEDGLVALFRKLSRLEDTETALWAGSDLLESPDEAVAAAAEPALARAARVYAEVRAYRAKLEEYRREARQERRERKEAAASPPPASPTQDLEQQLAELDSLPSTVDIAPTDEAFDAAFLGPRNRIMRAARSTPRRKVPPEPLARIYARLRTQSDPGRRFCLLGAFAQADLPCVEEAVLAGMDSPFPRIRWGTAAALSRMEDPRVRALGRRFLGEMPSRGDWTLGLKLLLASGQPEDLRIVAESLAAAPVRTMDADHLHGAVTDALDLVRRHPPDVSTPIMRWIYGASPCALCRRGAVEWLHENGRLPRAWRKECMDDSDEEIRALADHVTEGEAPA